MRIWSGETPVRGANHSAPAAPPVGVPITLINSEGELQAPVTCTQLAPGDSATPCA